MIVRKDDGIRCEKMIAGIAAATIVALTSHAAHSEMLPKRKPGLWEITMTGMPENADQGARMRARLESIPPEKRAAMEAQMARMGLGVPDANKDGSITNRMRVCLTPEEAADEMRGGGLDRFGKRDNCETKEISRTATELRYSSVCRQNGQVSKIDVHAYGITPESWNMDVRMVGSDGKERNMKQSTRWVSADCGSVGPSAKGPAVKGGN